MTALSKKTLEWLHYWTTCYECSEYPPCPVNRPCKTCRAQQKATQELENYLDKKVNT